MANQPSLKHFQLAPKTQLKDCIRNAIRHSKLAKTTSYGTLAALALLSTNSQAALLEFAIQRNSEANITVDEPTGTGATSINIGPVLTSTPNNDNWPSSCTVSGQIVIASATATAGADYSTPQTLDFELVAESTILSTDLDSKSNATVNQKPFSEVSQTINLDILADFEEEEPESLTLSFQNVRAICGGDGDVLDVTPTVFFDSYGATIDINDTFNERPVEPEEPSTDVPATQKSLIDQVDEISLLTLHSAETRTRSLSRELRRVRRGLKSVSTENLQVRVNGETIPSSVWQSMISDQNTLTGSGAGDDNDFGNWGVFVNGSIDIGERNSSASTDSEYKSSLIILGVDYQVNQNFILGGALSQTDLSSELDNKAADTDFKRSSLSLFSSYYHEDKYYLDLIASYGSSSYDLSRTVIDDSASADTDGTELSYSLGGGYDFHFNSIDLGIFTSVYHLESTIDGYTETVTGDISAAQVNEITLNSLIANLGMDLRWNISTQSGVVSPHIGVTFEHQFEDDATDINGNFIGGSDEGAFEFQSEKLDSSYIATQIGLTASFKGGFTTYIMYDTYIDRDDLSSNNYSLGARWQF